MYKVLMFGDTNYQHRSAIRREMRKLIRKHGTKNLLIIAGGAPGLARITERCLGIVPQRRE